MHGHVDLSCMSADMSYGSCVVAAGECARLGTDWHVRMGSNIYAWDLAGWRAGMGPDMHI